MSTVDSHFPSGCLWHTQSPLISSVPCCVSQKVSVLCEVTTHYAKETKGTVT